MTSNQLAYQSNIEIERHNRVTEEEAGRHNVETEGIAKEQNRLESWKIQVDDNYKRQSNRIQEEYNHAYIALQKAQGDKKLEIEEYLADLRRREQDLELFYNTQRLDIQRQQNAINSAANQETERHNKAMEQYQTDYMDRNFALENRKAEYTSTYYRDLITTKQAELEFNKNKALRDWLTNAPLISAQTSLLEQQYNTELLRQSNIEADTKLKGSQNVSTGFHVLWDGISAIGGAAGGAGKLGLLFME